MARADAETTVRAAGRADETADLVDRCGPEGVLDLVLDEVAARCDPSLVREPVTVGVELLGPHGSAAGTLHVDAGSVRADRASAPDPPVRLVLPAVEILRALYAPHGTRGPLVPEVEIDWPHSGGPDVYATAMHRFAAAIHAVTATWAPEPADLGRLIVRHGSDKWGAVHWYAPHYERHFRRLADEPVRLLEIGIGGFRDPARGGESLRVWQSYFRRGMVHGLDVVAKPGVCGPRIRTVRGDQNDPAFLRELAERIGPLDIVVDDGSHVSEHVRTAFGTLFPLLRDGGVYVVEDLQTSYWPAFGGASPDEPGAPTSMNQLKSLADVLHHREYPSASTPFDGTVASVHFYHNLAFVEKAVDRERGAPSWIPGRPRGRHEAERDAVGGRKPDRGAGARPVR